MLVRLVSPYILCFSGDQTKRRLSCEYLLSNDGWKIASVLVGLYTVTKIAIATRPLPLFSKLVLEESLKLPVASSSPSAAHFYSTSLVMTKQA